MKRIKLYADEDIEDPVVEALRAQGINIVSAREVGNRGKADSFQAAWAFKHKRFILTRNAKDFLDERLLPFHHTYGVIAIEGDLSDLRTLAGSLVHLTDIVPYEEIYRGSKIKLSRERIIVQSRAEDGSIFTFQAKYDRSGAFVWEE
jgi:predicted nuclease of predicted toxin-antitoxin system